MIRRSASDITKRNNNNMRGKQGFRGPILFNYLTTVCYPAFKAKDSTTSKSEVAMNKKRIRSEKHKAHTDRDHHDQRRIH
jgi:hypothetical protein